MGIYIPGIETPKGHTYVTITIWHSGTASYGLFDREGNLSDFKSIKVAPVPEHGRMGDLDRLEQMFVDIDNAPYSGFDGTEPFYSAEDAAQIIRLAPTIIPAEPAREEKT